MNHAFSKILIFIILTILVAGGIFTWQYFGVPKEEVKDETTDWKTYKNKEYGFEIRYPQDAEVVESQFKNTDRINLSFVSGTLLREKYLIIGIKTITSIEACSNPLGTGIVETRSVRVDDVDFKKEIGSDAGVGSLYESESYSTVRDNKCFNLSFVLHSVNPGMFDVPPPDFDREKESKIFNQILSTFKFLEIKKEGTTEEIIPSRECAQEGEAKCDVMGCRVCCDGLVDRYVKTPMRNKSGEVVCVEEMTVIRCVRAGDGICSDKENWCITPEDCPKPNPEDLELFPF